MQDALEQQVEVSAFEVYLVVSQDLDLVEVEAGSKAGVSVVVLVRREMHTAALQVALLQ